MKPNADCETYSCSAVYRAIALGLNLNLLVKNMNLHKCEMVKFTTVEC